MWNALCRAWSAFRHPDPHAKAALPAPILPPLADSGEIPNYYTPIFDFDGVRTDPTIIHNHDFMKEPRYRLAQQRGEKAHGDSQQYWRLHVALWAASHAVQLPGDFVECGVWKGYLSSAIMSYLDWNRLEKKFYLFDTYCGLDETLVSEEEVAKGNLEHFRKHYVDNYKEVLANFAEYPNAVVVRGSVPETLLDQPISSVAYLSLDMNNAKPEIEAAHYFWDKLVPGAVILLDDYGFVSYEVQKKSFDQFAREKQIPLLALPSGQGLMIKTTDPERDRIQ